MSLNKKAIDWVVLADQCQTPWVRKKYNQILIFINIHFSPFYHNMQRTLRYIIWCICRHAQCTQGVQNHGNTAFYPHKIHIAKSLYILKKKSLVSLVLQRLGLCLQFSPLFSRHMSFFCQIKFTFRRLASIENALITSIDSNLGVNQFPHA